MPTVSHRERPPTPGLALGFTDLARTRASLRRDALLARGAVLGSGHGESTISMEPFSGRTSPTVYAAISASVVTFVELSLVMTEGLDEGTLQPATTPYWPSGTRRH